MNNQPTYLTLIQSLLNSPEDEQIAILQANLELIDDNFAQYLREWATQTLAEMDSDEAYNFASNIYSFNIVIGDFPLGSRANNLEIAIACDEIALIVWNRDDYAKKWAMIQNSMAIDYSQRIREDRAENIEKAIACYELALEVRTRAAFPQQWATTQNNLANAYSDRIREDKAENIEKAIACYDLALEVRTRAAFPQQWATTQNNLATAYRNRIREDKAENIEKAIACYDLALEVSTRAAFPQQWATTQNNLAIAYRNRIREDKAENIEKAIACYELALEVYTRATSPQDWAMTQNNLAIAYYSRIREDKAENIEKAIACYELALEVRTRAASPQQWATTQNNLGLAYSDRIREDKAENIEKAIACYDLALLVYTRADFPQDWAMTQNNLATAYSDRIREDKAENIEKAIAFFQAVLEVCTRKAFTQDLAVTKNNLVNAYRNRVKGNNNKNIEKAIACYQAALLVYTPTALPIECLIAARSLGNLGFAQSLWETAIFGYEKAIEAVEQSREWIASENRKREIIGENLNVYEKMIQSCINHQQYHKAIQTIERSKSRYLVELFTNSEIYPKTATATEKQQLQNLRRQIASLQQFLETQTPISPLPTPVSHLPPPLTKGGPGGVPDSPSQRTTQTRPHTPELSQQQEKLVTALQQLEQFLETFKQREPEFKLTQKIQPIDIAEFQKTLDPKTAIIEWYIGNSNSPLLKGGWGGSDPSITTNNSNSNSPLLKGGWGGSAFIITRDNIELITYTTTEIAQLETWKDNYLNQYRDKKTNKTWQQTLSQKLEQLSQILRLNEIVAKIPTTSQQLILVPHRYLHLFPLHALPLEGEHAPSTAPTREENTLAKGGLREENTLAKGGLREENTLAKGGLREENSFAKGGLREENSFAKGGLREEKPLANGGLEKDGLETKRYVTLRSGRKAIPEKCLTLGDIFGELQLPKCSLVTLSACETGLTSSTTMTDEYIGLPSGFLYAGSMNVVSSLWAVDDFATAILMIKFYQELPNADSVAIALNAAQNWMRGVNREDFLVWIGLLKLDKKSMKTVKEWLSYSSKDKPPFKDPEYWAAFCATGY
ncbi:MAG: CHAT domain-containing tetratricopeptide repeat protein [Microcoleus sp.]